MKKYLITAITLCVGFMAQSSYALDRNVMWSNPEVQYGCQDVIHDGVQTKICYKTATHVVPKFRDTIANSTWSIVSLNGKAITSSGTLTLSGRTMSAKLCNNVSGRYHVIGKTLVLRNTISTMMYCDTDIMPVETAIGKANLAKLSLSGTTLTMKTRHDIIVWKKQ